MISEYPTIGIPNPPFSNSPSEPKRVPCIVRTDRRNIAAEEQVVYSQTRTRCLVITPRPSPLVTLLILEKKKIIPTHSEKQISETCRHPVCLRARREGEFEQQHGIHFHAAKIPTIWRSSIGFIHPQSTIDKLCGTRSDGSQRSI